jgi:hypothetical protein
MAGEVGLFARDFDNADIIRTLHASSDGVLVTIPYNTQQTHSGRFFYCNFYNASVASSGTIDILLVTNSRYSPHLGVMVDIGGSATLSIYEAVTTSNDGTTLSAINANRTSSNAATALVYHTPTVTNTGTTLLLDHYIAGGATGNPIGGTSTDFARITELVLKLSTKYLFRVTNRSASAVAGSVQLGWFEGT